MHARRFASQQVQNPSDEHLYQRTTVKNPEPQSSAPTNAPPTAPYGALSKYCTFHKLCTVPHAPAQPAACSWAIHSMRCASHQVRSPSDKHLYQRTTVKNPEHRSFGHKKTRGHSPKIISPGGAVSREPPKILQEGSGRPRQKLQ